MNNESVNVQGIKHSVFGVGGGLSVYGVGVIGLIGY